MGASVSCGHISSCSKRQNLTVRKCFVIKGCLLGRKLVIERRIPHADCFNGRDYDREITLRNCSCTRQDFEWCVPEIY